MYYYDYEDPDTYGSFNNRLMYYETYETCRVSSRILEIVADATWVIPSEDEWYKVAYHYNDRVTGNYWDYRRREVEPGDRLRHGYRLF